MAAIGIAAESASRGPSGILVRGSEFPTSKYHSGGYYRFADITLGTNGDDTCTVPHLLFDYRTAIWYIAGTTVALDAGEELDIYLQTTYDGVNWYDVRAIHWANADGDLPAIRAVATIFTEPIDTSATVKYSSLLVEGEDATTNFKDGTTADDTEVDLPLGLGTRARIKTTNAATGTLSLVCILK